ncbi:hypothetical protein CIPAW_03G100500 [Carya illinoinensis]|uniref:Uncharacterized protein n=1 Tax=Carya illinoinensis TaxID=32201 RepID=A0A8T1QZ05_CARIL|nr:hypothetical protein CIPAW_03G100500 [Carya illinoinensis]
MRQTPVMLRPNVLMGRKWRTISQISNSSSTQQLTIQPKSLSKKRMERRGWGDEQGRSPKRISTRQKQHVENGDNQDIASAKANVQPIGKNENTQLECSWAWKPTGHSDSSRTNQEGSVQHPVSTRNHKLD